MATPITRGMSLAAALDRVAELQVLLQPAGPAPVATASAAQPTTTFSSALASASTGPVAPQASAAGGSSAGRAALAAAQPEVGVAEQPPGFNDSPRIAQYRSAVAGAPGPGP